MRVKEECIPCVINQVIKVANITKVENKKLLLQNVFKYLGDFDFSRTSPEIIGETFKLIKESIQNEDPYKEIRNYYNDLFLEQFDTIESKIDKADDSFLEAIKYAVIGNIIDFNPIHDTKIEDVMSYFDAIDKYTLYINHSDKLKNDIKQSNTLLYLGDNCGEICFDKLLIKKIKQLNPNLMIYFATRGAPVVNDSILEDAYHVKMDDYATIISNGDYSLGTVLSRVSEEFKTIYNKADLVIAKGQANYESLSEENKNIYFLLMGKCEVIAKDIGVPLKSLICMNKQDLVQ